MSTESRPTAAEINETAKAKLAGWRGYQKAAQEFPRLKNTARRLRNIGSVATAAVGSYFGYAMAMGESATTNVLLGGLTVAALGQTVLGERLHSVRERQIAEAPRREAKLAADMLTYARDNGVPLSHEPGVDDLEGELLRSARPDAPEETVNQMRTIQTPEAAPNA